MSCQASLTMYIVSLCSPSHVTRSRQMKRPLTEHSTVSLGNVEKRATLADTILLPVDVIALKSLRPQVNWLYDDFSTWASLSYWLTLSVACCPLAPLSWRSRKQSLSNICPTTWHLPHLFCATEPRSDFRIILPHSSPWPPTVPRNAYVRWHLLAFPTCIGIIRQCRLDKLVYSWTYIITALSHFTNIIYASNK